MFALNIKRERFFFVQNKNKHKTTTAEIYNFCKYSAFFLFGCSRHPTGKKIQQEGRGGGFYERTLKQQANDNKKKEIQ